MSSLSRIVPLLLALGMGQEATAAPPAWMVSANESKLDLDTGVSRRVPDAAPDTLTFLDFGTFPPGVRHLTNIPNTVIGPPSNVAVSPDGRLAVVADSLEPGPGEPATWRPSTRLHLLDLSGATPRLVGEAQAGPQASGVAFAPDGRHVFVANRAGGSVSWFRRDGLRLEPGGTVPFTHPTNEVSDVAVSHDGRTVLAAVREGQHLQVLRFDGTELAVAPARISVYGRPYRVLFTPDGELAVTAGAGSGNGADVDAMTVIDARTDPPRAIDYVPLANGPESLAMSPDGRLVVGALMNGSNVPADSPYRTDHGLLVVARRKGRTFERVQALPTGRIPEGVEFSPDGRYVVVQCHPDRELRLYRVRSGRLTELPLRIPVPGFPSGLGRGH